MYDVIKEKFTVKFVGGFAQIAYMNMQDKEITFSDMTYKDGSVSVVSNDVIPDHDNYIIEAFIESMDDLMIVAQMKDIIDRNSKAQKRGVLVILSPVYSRYDRVMHDDKLDSFGAKVFADFINALKFDNVIFYDCHSDVLVEKVWHGNSIDQEGLVNARFSNLSKYNIVAPDKGAVKKNPSANVICDKVRDVKTGKITGLEISEVKLKEKAVDFLVIDDICEGGRTFIEVAKQLNNGTIKRDIVSKLNLYITHGIFSNNAIYNLLSVYNNIYVHFMKKSVYDALPKELQRHVIVYNLINI